MQAFMMTVVVANDRSSWPMRVIKTLVNCFRIQPITIPLSSDLQASQSVDLLLLIGRSNCLPKYAKLLGRSLREERLWLSPMIKLVLSLRVSWSELLHDMLASIGAQLGCARAHDVVRR